MYPSPTRNHPESGQCPLATRTEFAQLLPRSRDPEIRSATLFLRFSPNARREAQSVPNSAVSLQAASQARAILGSLRSGSKVETRVRRPVFSAFPDPQFCAPGKVLAANLNKVSPSGPRCWKRRRGVTRARAGMRAVAAAAAAAAGVVTTGGGRRLASCTVPPATRGSARPDSCAGITRRPCPELLPPRKSDPANNTVSKLVNLEVTSGNGRESDPSSVRAPTPKSLVGALDPL